MLHPAIESLLFLKLARNSVVDSINESDIEESEELTSYIQNEASDYEIMHLITMGEMPEDKFNSLDEEVVWESFQKDMVKAYDYLTLEEGYDYEDVDRLIFEMGPIAPLGLSSAKPIMELHQQNGFYNQILTEERLDPAQLTGRNRKAYIKSQKTLLGTAKAKALQTKNQIKNKAAAAQTKASELYNTGKTKLAGTKAGKAVIDAGKTIKDQTIQKKNIVQNKWAGLSGNQKLAAKGVGGAAVLAGAGYLAYKLYKKLRDKFSKEKDPEKKAAIKTKMKKAKAKMKK